MVPTYLGPVLSQVGTVQFTSQVFWSPGVSPLDDVAGFRVRLTRPLVLSTLLSTRFTYRVGRALQSMLQTRSWGMRIWRFLVTKQNDPSYGLRIRIQVIKKWASQICKLKSIVKTGKTRKFKR